MGLSFRKKERERESARANEGKQRTNVCKGRNQRNSNQINKWINFMLPKDYPHFQFIFTPQIKTQFSQLHRKNKKQVHTDTQANNDDLKWILNLPLFSLLVAPKMYL